MPGIIFRHKPDDLVKSHEFSSNVNPRNTKCMDACPDGFPIGVVKIFALTRGVHTPRPSGSPSANPIPLSCGIVLEPEQKFAFLKNPAAPLSGISATLHQASLQGMFCLAAVLRSDCKEFYQFFDSLANPAVHRRRTGNPLAVQFKGLPRSMQTADIRIAFAWFKELIQKGRTNTFFAYPTKNP